MGAQAMSNVRIFKFNGSIQGYPESQASTPAAMRAQLADVVGEAVIVHMSTSQLRMKPCFGMPSGAINVYDITALAWFILENREGGPLGFARLSGWQGQSNEAIDAFTLPERRLRERGTAHPLREFARSWASN